MSFDLKGWLPLVVVGLAGYGCVRFIATHDANVEATAPDYIRRVDTVETMNACERAVMAQLANPSTYERRASIEDELQTKPGMTIWRTSFQAKNSFNFVKRFRLVCSMRYDGIVDARFSEIR